MLNRIIKLSLASRAGVLVASAIVLVVGIIALMRTEVDIFPDLNAPTVVVMTEANGLAPEEVERMVTYPIETAVNGASGVRRVRSSSATGFSVVWIEFDWGTDPYLARQIVAERTSGLADKMPPGVGVPTLGPQSSILGEMMIIGLTSDSIPMLELRDVADRLLEPRLLAIDGVAQVSVIGGEEKEYQIQLSQGRMAALGVTLTEVLGALDNVNANAGGGILYQYGNEYIVKGDVSVADMDEIGLSVVRADETGVVLLRDIAQVRVAGKTPLLGAAAVRAHPAVLLTVTKQPGVGTIGLTRQVEKVLDESRASMPAGIDVHTDIFRQSDFIANSISNLQRSLFEGAIFVALVLFFFLMNFRTTLISIVALPMSIIITVLVLRGMGYTINTMSLGGIAIAIGSLVDDAIVDVENVYKRLRENFALPQAERKPLLEVVFHASAEVRMPIFNSSLIIIASFMPLFFLSGMEGRLLIPLGVSFIVSIIASTIVALTLTPVLSSLLLGTKAMLANTGRDPWAARKLKAWYSKALASLLATPARGKIALWCTGIAFGVAICLFFTLGRSFLPSFNEGSFTINVSTLPGVSLAESDRIGAMAEDLILSVPEIKTTARKTGRSELDEHSLGANVSEIEAPYKLKERSRSQVAADIRSKLAQLPGVNIEIGQPISHRIDAMLSGTEAQIAIKLFGDDLNQLFAVGNQIKAEVGEVPGVVDVNIEQQIERPQLDIRPKRQMLAAAGISMPEFRQVVEAAIGGAQVSTVYENSKQYDLTVILDSASRSSIQDIADIMIDSRYGKMPLSSVADIVSTTGPNGINRENAKRRIVISANVEDRDLRGAVEDIKEKIASEVDIPENCYVEYGGQFESEARSSAVLLWASLGALLVIFMLLYHEFRSVKEALIILVNMPLAMIGGVLILVLTGGELNIPAIIGFISLLGIATRNGMLLISRFNHLREQGLSIRDTIERGSVDRLLPIIMTALTSALALVPLAVNGSKPGNEIQSPMAIVILGGLVSSTILNIFIVPVLYKLAAKTGSNQTDDSEKN